MIQHSSPHQKKQFFKFNKIEYLNILNNQIVTYDNDNQINSVDIKNTYFEFYFLIEIEEIGQAVQIANHNWQNDQLKFARLLIDKGYHDEVFE